jgi:outer membrane protein TolC
MKNAAVPGFAVALFAAARLAVAADARAPHLLGLEEARTRALSKNYAIAIERESHASAVERVHAALGIYDSELKWSGGFDRRTDPVNSLLSGAPRQKVAPQFRSLGLDVSLVRLLPSGGSLSFFAAGDRARSDGAFSLLSPAYTSTFGVELRQPLLRDRAIDPARSGIRVARSERGRSAASLARTVSDTLAAVEAAYWTLLAAQQNVAVREAAVELAGQQLEETRHRISAGALPENEEAQPRAELERRKGERLAAQEQATRAENALKALILDDGSESLWGMRLVPRDAAETEAVALDVGAAIRAAVEKRPEIREAEAALASREVELQASRDQLKPRLDAFAAYTRRGLAGSLNPTAAGLPGQPVVVPRDLEGGLGRSLGTVADALYPDFRVGLTLSVPLGNRSAKAAAAAARAGERRAAAELGRVRQAVRVEVLNASAAVEAAAERVAAARAAREAAEIQLASEKERFGVGLSTNFLVLTRQNELSRARLDLIEALSDHRKALTELERAAGLLLRNRRVEIGDDASAQAASGGDTR